MGRSLSRSAVGAAGSMGHGKYASQRPIRGPFAWHAVRRRRARRAGTVQRHGGEPTDPMTLNLADIERWDAEAVRTVFAAAIRRAHGTRTASAAITEMMRLSNFGGDA